MNCFPCFGSKKSDASSSPEDAKKNQKPGATAPNGEVDISKINAKSFTFRDLLAATDNFGQAQLLGEGEFGRVFKGTIQESGQVVAVKELDRTMQEQNEFLVEVLRLSLLHHENLVELVGYCAEGDQRLLVYEFMSGGSLDHYLHDIGGDKKPLDWFARLKIAYGAAQGMEYLHEKTNPPVIYRDMNSANVLLNDGYDPKLSDFGMVSEVPRSRVMGTYGYSAPEYTKSGQVTLMSDVFSYGVVLLELITGRKAIDTTKPNDEQNLVSWAQPFFKDPKKYSLLADPLLNHRFPDKGLNQTVAICAMCLQEEPMARPLISDVVVTLSFLSVPGP